MEFPFIQKTREIPIPEDQLELPAFQRDEEIHPQDYIMYDGLMQAVNVALLMGQPLLLTGEPGSGKTCLAERVAWELGLLPVLTFATKSTSQAKDLFYTYDYLARFHAANSQGDVSPKGFITFHALGEAIIRGNPKEKVEKFLPPGFVHQSRKRSVVLIDEIDKAPRDFPNDILNEIERLKFCIPEIDPNDPICTDAAHAPLIFITSNSEKLLPRPFLRRCVYYHIEFPGEKRLQEIVHRRLLRMPSRMNRASSPDDTFIANAVDLFTGIRKQMSEETRPATAELILWVAAMRDLSDKKDPITQDPNAVKAAMHALIKSKSEKVMALKIYGNGQWKPKTT
jgi:MoxR-like ATPase